jgi:hypothetical protein
VLGEPVLVDDDRGALVERADVGDQRGGVHRHQHVRVVARREDVARGEVDLERGHAGGRAGGGADLGGEVGQRGQVVPGHRGLLGEARAHQLHAVTGIPRKADDYAILLLERLVGHTASG